LLDPSLANKTAASSVYQPAQIFMNWYFADEHWVFADKHWFLADNHWFFADEQRLIADEQLEQKVTNI
jgi:hypothetical protein